MDEWTNGEWSTPRGHQDQMMQELPADDRLCMEIFEDVMLMCEKRFREIDFFLQDSECVGLYSCIIGRG